MATHLILGTAGHIDHGKTSLVKALTGVDTDRLPEEKQRGITIDLGFAELELGEFRLGIVDVPGHERFVRNMLAGATGIDLALLVVAADDSVKPQTREHFEILRLLDLEAGVIALTKCDLADPDWIALVEDEIRELVDGTFLAGAPIVRVSSITGQGVDELRRALREAAGRAAEQRAAASGPAPFRMAIDRVFTATGFGTVVTGSVTSGVTHIGDELVIQPAGTPVRVRGLQSHDRPAESVERGQRAAINLAGVHHEEIGRGQELSAPGHLVPSQRMSVRLGLLESAYRPLKNRTRVRVHLGTAELLASVLLLDGEQLEPGRWGLAQLFLSEPAVASWGQPFVVRSESPVVTIGGGQVLDATAPRLKRGDNEALQQLNLLWSDEALERAAAAIYFAGWRAWRPEELARAAGVEDGAGAVEQLIQKGSVRTLRLPPQREVRVHQLVFEQLAARIEAALSKLHEQFPLHTVIERARLLSRFDYLQNDALVEAMLNEMARTKRLRVAERGLALPGHGPQLSSGEQKLLEQLVAQYGESGFQPPSVEEARGQATKNQASVAQLLALAAAEGRLVQVSPEYYFHAEAIGRIRELLSQAMAGETGITVAQIRDLLGTSRKYTLPLCEYFDRIGFTRRQGDLRFLVARQAGESTEHAAGSPRAVAPS